MSERMTDKRFRVLLGWILLCSWTSFLIGSSAAVVGKPVECSGSYHWFLPFTMVFVCLFPAWLGWLIGRGE